MQYDKKKPQSRVQERIEQAVAYRREAWELQHKETGFKDRAERNYAYLRGEQRPNNTPDGDYVINNCLDTPVDVILAGLTTARTRIVGDSRSPEWSPHARLGQEILSARHKELKVDHEYRKELYDFLAVGYGVIFQGWIYSDDGTSARIAKQEADYGLPEGQFQFGPDGRIAHIQADEETGEPAAYPMPLANLKMRQVARLNENYFVHLPSKDCYFDPAETDFNTLHRSRYFVWRESKSQQEIEAAYGEEFTSGEKGDGMMDVWNYFGEDPEEPLKMIHCVYVEGKKASQKEDEEWPFHYWPIKVISELISSDGKYPISRVDRCIADQDMANAAETQLHNHRKRWNRFGFIEEQLLDPKVTTGIKHAVDGEYIPVKKPAADRKLEDSFSYPPMLQLQPEVYNTRIEAPKRINSRMGVTPPQLAQTYGQSSLATEMKQIAVESPLRGKALSVLFREHREENARLMLEIIKDNLDQDDLRAVEWFDSEERRLWMEFTGGLLHGDYAIDIEVIDEMFDSPEASAAKWAGLIQALMPFATGATDPVTGAPAGMLNPETGKAYIQTLKPLLEKFILASGYNRPDVLFGESGELRDLQFQQFLQGQNVPNTAQQMPVGQGVPSSQGAPLPAPPAGMPTGLPVAA